ncbi:hypothetical protein D3C81_1413310 [compost metagenome]
MAMKAIIPTAAMATNAARHPSCWPIQVPSGTPVTVAMVRPENMMEIALALRFSGTRSAAIVEPIDINTPCASAEITRAVRSRAILPETAARLLPAIKTSIIHIRSVLRGTPEVKEVNTGAPKVTPRAYSVTVSPARVTEICRLPAIRGSRPTLMNSVVPMAKALIASARSAKVLLFLSKDISSTPKYSNCQPANVIMYELDRNEQYVL